MLNIKTKELEQSEKQNKKLQNELKVYKNNFIESYIKKDVNIKNLNTSLDELIKNTDSTDSLNSIIVVFIKIIN